MRHRRWPRPTPFEDTSRKRAAFIRKQRLEREALPLFANQIAAEQHGVDDEMILRAICWDKAERRRRSERAVSWRKVRSRFFALPGALRWTVGSLWRTCPYPADPSYLADLLHQVAVGRIDPHRPPWIFHQAISPRVTRNPASFDEAFRQIGAFKAGGGPETAAAGELLFCGNLGSGIVFLRSRGRPIELNESSDTLANHRQPDSHAGRSGHLVDIEVWGECSDADLVLIGRLTEAADKRPAAVRRAGKKKTGVTR